MYAMYNSETLAGLIDNVDSMCRVCAYDLKNKTNGIPIFNRDNLPEKIARYLYINVNSTDKLPHLICNDCAIKIDNFHNLALFAQKNQDIFNRINAERIYQEHCKSLSSLNTTLYRETPAQPPNMPHSTAQPGGQGSHQPTIPNNIQPAMPSTMQDSPHQVEVVSTEDITIFAYNDLKLGQVIKDNELLKLILRALKWGRYGETMSQQLERLRNTSFRNVMTNPELLHDEDLTLLLGPYLDKNAFGGNQKMQPVYGGDANAITEMEVGVDPELFFPYDDEESKGAEIEEVRNPNPIQEKRTRKIVPKKRIPKSKLTILPLPSSTTVDTVPSVDPPKEDILEVSILPETEDSKEEIKTPNTPPPDDIIKASSPEKSPSEQPQLVQRILQKSREALRATRVGRKDDKKDSDRPNTRARTTKSQTYKCQVCNKKLSTKGNLNVHMRTHKQGKTGKLTCEKCGRVFKSQTNLQRHKEFHTKERFTCRTCNRVYPSSATLKQHEASHSSTRPHKCGICNKMFKRNQDLKFHINQHSVAGSGNCFSHRKRVHADEMNKKTSTRKA